MRCRSGVAHRMGTSPGTSNGMDRISIRISMGMPITSWDISRITLYYVMLMGGRSFKGISGGTLHLYSWDGIHSSRSRTNRNTAYGKVILG